MAERSLLNQLVDALRCLPGVGPKSAQRMAFHLLQRDRDFADYQDIETRTELRPSAWVEPQGDWGEGRTRVRTGCPASTRLRIRA